MKKTFKTLSIIAVIAIITLGTASCASLTIASVDWDSVTGPEKVRQYIGVSTQQVTVFAHYKDESRKEVTFLSVNHDKDRTGIQNVTVKVLGQEGSGTFQTEVMELTGITVQRAPTKTTYNVGERADLSGIRVVGSWRDLPDAELYTYQIEVASFDSSSAGNKIVTVNFKGRTATFPVIVTAPAEVTAPAATASTPAAPTATTPSTQQPSAEIQWPPAANQPLPVGSWTNTGTYLILTLNANGTGMYIHSQGLTWTARGNIITLNYLNDSGAIWRTVNYTYSVSGNTLTWLSDQPYASRETFTRTR